MQTQIERDKGVIKFFKPDRGFGFIQRKDGEDVFVHANELKKSGVDATIRAGDHVEFDVVSGEKGIKAQAIKVIEAA